MSKPNWSKQSERLWKFLVENVGKDCPAPACNRAAAGPDAQYVASISKRISECRAKAKSLGGDLVLSRDEWEFYGDGSRRRFTHYRLRLP